MRRFVPGIDSYLGAGIPASLMRFTESDDGASGGLTEIHDIALILEKPTTLIEKYRQLCYWRQVVNAEHN
jgi:hypothetical protein